MSTSPLGIDPWVVNNLVGNRFLDAACGYGKWGTLLKMNRFRHPGPVHVTGLDLFEPHIEALRGRGVYDELAVGSVLEIPFPDQHFDAAVACEVIEHLPDGSGPKLFAELRRVCTKSFVISTPNFDCLRPGHETRDGFNPYEAHLYNPPYDEFAALGFTQVVGLGMPRLPSWKLRTALHQLGYFFPRYSEYLLGFWFADGKKRNMDYV